MTTFLMGRKTVEYLREARSGDHGFNPSKPRMVLIDIPGEGQRTVPFAHLKVLASPKPAASSALDSQPAARTTRRARSA